MLMIKCCIAFGLLSTAVLISKPFFGDVLDKEYVKDNKLAQIIKTDSSEATKGIVWTTTYKFNENGWIIEKREHGTEVLTTHFTYDENGNLSETKTMNARGIIQATEKMVYDTKSRIKECEIRKIADKITISDKIEWIDDSTMHTTRVMNGTTSRFLKQYDSKKRLIDEMREDGSGLSYIYDGDLLLMKKQKAGAPNIERFEYDDYKRVSLIENANGIKSFIYGASGRLVSTNTKDDNGRTLAWERYEYAPTAN